MTKQEFKLDEEMEKAYKQFVEEKRTAGELFSWLFDINKEFIKMSKEELCEKTHASGKRGSLNDLVCPTLLKMEKLPKWYSNMDLTKLKKKKCKSCKEIDKLAGDKLI